MNPFVIAILLMAYACGAFGAFSGIMDRGGNNGWLVALAAAFWPLWLPFLVFATIVYKTIFAWLP